MKSVRYYINYEKKDLMVVEKNPYSGCNVTNLKNYEAFCRNEREVYKLDFTTFKEVDEVMKKWGYEPFDFWNNEREDK